MTTTSSRRLLRGGRAPLARLLSGSSLPKRARAIGALTALSLVAPLTLEVSAPRSDRAATRPNIVLILTDDQRWDTIATMPKVQSQLTGRGVRFSNAFAVNPWCCPSRASFLTGQYSHRHGVYTNHDPLGSVTAFDPSSTVVTWLNDAGYRTGLVGKYLNGYIGPMTSTVPPGWDRWVAFSSHHSGGAYYNYSLSIDGTNRSYGSAPSDYSTDVLASKAESFIRNTNPADPLFLYYTPYAPHGPVSVAPRHATSFSDLPPWRPPSYNEVDVSDKPAYIRNRPLLNATTNPDSLRRKMLQSLLAVDDAVGRIVEALRDTGRLSNTLIVFASDHGYLWGEHRWTDKAVPWNGKVVPYDESTRIALVMRYDAMVSAPKTDNHLAANIDLAPTFAQLAGVAAPGVEGQSLVPHLTSTHSPTRPDLLIEHVRDTHQIDTVPTYCAVRNLRHLYVYYATGERELYDMSVDPFQLNNLRGAQSASVRSTLHARLRELCVPEPPGLTLPPE